MLNFLKKEANLTFTENGAITNHTSGSYCLDLFATIGALRCAPATEIINRFTKAYTEDPLTALKIAFFARDIRGGLGERRVFRTIINHLALKYPETVIKNIANIPEYGRFDDLYELADTAAEDNMFEFIKLQLDADLEGYNKNTDSISLMGKWLPSVNTSNPDTVRLAKKTAKRLGLSDAEYRKTLSKLRRYIDIIENHLREKDYTFDYTKQTSKAMYKYKKAFMRNDGERYTGFLNAVIRGEAKLNTGTLYPYEIIRDCCKDNLTKQEKDALNVTWNNLAAAMNNENAIAVIDGSGSMYGIGNPRPIDIAVSLGLFFAENNEGAFKNHFITFSEKPQLVEIKGNNIFDKARYSMSFNEVANTNLQRVFELILHTAVKHRLPQNQLPKTIYIISDMEFDSCTVDANNTIFEHAKKAYSKMGYTLPNLVFWNVQSRNMQVPVTENELGVSLVNGASPKLFEMVVSGNLDPYAFMNEVISSERYNRIVL